MDKLKLEERLANARLLQAEAHRRYVNDPVWPYPRRDENGRSPQDQWHYWSGVVDTYEYLVKLASAMGVA